MIDWFRQLSQREQLVLGGGAILAVIIIGWSFVWTPLRDGTGDLSARVAERARQVVDLRRAASLTTASAGAVVRDAPTLYVLIEETARSNGLGSTITRSNMDGADAINVTFRDARFDRLIGWLVQLEQGNGLTAVSATFTGAGSPGLVSGQLRLER